MIEEYYVMWLSRIEGIGFQRFQRLISYFGSGEAIFYATKQQLFQVKNLPSTVIQTILDMQDENILNDWIEELEEKEIEFYSYYHESYPYLLKHIYNPPIGLYVRGELPDDNIDYFGQHIGKLV